MFILKTLACEVIKMCFELYKNVFFAKELDFFFFFFATKEDIGELGQLKLMNLISKIENSLLRLL